MRLRNSRLVTETACNSSRAHFSAHRLIPLVASRPRYMGVDLENPENPPLRRRKTNV